MLVVVGVYVVNLVDFLGEEAGSVQSYIGLGGQQRITSLGRFLSDQFAIRLGDNDVPQYFSSLPKDKQELLNAIYSGPFVTLCKAEYSNSK